jgi:YD repeat-containing protein
MQQATKVSGLPAEKINMHCTLVGGGFGRRLFADYVAEAVELSKALRRPVQVLWTRQDDMRHGYFEPATTHRYRAGYDAQGNIIAVTHQLSQADLTIYEHHEGRSIWSGTPRPAKKREDFDAGEAMLYEYPAFRVDAVDASSPVPTGPWRAVASPSTVFARESFIDELAHAMEKDPFALRIELLSRSQQSSRGPDRRRLIRVLEELRRRSGWDAAMPSVRGRLVGRGVAGSVYADTSYIGMVAEVSVAADLSDLRVTRVFTVVDCGLVVNPLGIEGQTESAITWGLSAALHGKLDFVDGAAVQSTYAEFRVLRMNEMPKLETTFLESHAAPSGYGEHPVPVIAPAVANAVAAACGRRVRSLPITPSSMRS